MDVPAGAAAEPEGAAAGAGAEEAATHQRTHEAGAPPQLQEGRASTGSAPRCSRPRASSVMDYGSQRALTVSSAASYVPRMVRGSVSTSIGSAVT
jgi:hypothetical protein